MKLSFNNCLLHRKYDTAPRKCTKTQFSLSRICNVSREYGCLIRNFLFFFGNYYSCIIIPLWNPSCIFKSKVLLDTHAGIRRIASTLRCEKWRMKYVKQDKFNLRELTCPDSLVCFREMQISLSSYSFSFPSVTWFWLTCTIRGYGAVIVYRLEGRARTVLIGITLFLGGTDLSLLRV